MLTQNLPATASDYARRSRREQQAAIAAVRRQWNRMGDDFDRSWLTIAPTIMAIIGTAQQRTAELAVDYIPAVLEETGQTRAIETDEVPVTAAFAGVTGSGLPIEAVLAAAPIRAKQARQGTVDRDGDTTTYRAGANATQALAQAGRWLNGVTGTILSDTARAAESTAMGIRPVSGWVRMLTPPSCGRCAVLAGRRYRISQGFDRHPGCDCRHIPASEAIAGDLTLDVGSYFDSLDEAGQIKMLGSRANYVAVKEYGADLNQIINAYRRGSLRTAQDRFGNTIQFTAEGVTKRGWGGSSMRNRTSRLDIDAGAIQIGSKRELVRRMPETILRTTQSREQIIRQFRIYGWTVRP